MRMRVTCLPHGMSVDSKGRIWVTDQQSKDGKGAQVFAFDRTGKKLAVAFWNTTATVYDLDPALKPVK